MYHGADAARAAREHFERTIQRGEAPEDLSEIHLGAARTVVEVVLAAEFAKSKRDAVRLVTEGAVRVDGMPVTDVRAPWPTNTPAVLQVGARRFVRVLP
jgi:tyrosyl-tRNA synthetase